MYPIIEVPETAWAAEQLGTKYKFWFLNAEKRPVLFKQGRLGTGENWSEKVCCELAELLGIPHAQYELARWKTIDGVITTNVVKKGARLVLGNELLRRTDDRKYKGSHHTISRVMAMMRNVMIRPSSHPALDLSLSASEVFLGYLMLDALVGNSDRHDQNWGVIATPNAVELASTFDHASSLGRNESDEKRVERLLTKDTGNNVEAYSIRARSALYQSKTDTKALTTFDAYVEATIYAPKGKRYWLQKLDEITSAQINSILKEIPDTVISEPARQFAMTMISFNKTRLLHLASQ